MFRSRGPTPTGIQHKSLGISNGIWNLDWESGILADMVIHNFRIFLVKVCNLIIFWGCNIVTSHVTYNIRSCSSTARVRCKSDCPGTLAGSAVLSATQYTAL